MPPMRAFQQRLPGVFARVGRDILALVRQGEPVSEAMSRFPSVFSALEVSLVRVGEATGRRDLAYRSLRDWFESVSRLRAKVISGLVYPAVVYHVAALLIPLITVFTDGVGWERAGWQALGLLLAPWVVLAVGSRLWPLIGATGLPLAVPLLGGLLYRLDCTRFFTALALCLRSGFGSLAAVRLAADCCRNAAMRRRFRRVAGVMEAEGCGFATALSEGLGAGSRDSMVIELMQTGELAGAADEAAGRIATVYRDEAETTMARAAVLIPNLAYLCLAGYVAFRIIGFYGRIFAPVRDLLE